MNTSTAFERYLDLVTLGYINPIEHPLWCYAPNKYCRSCKLRVNLGLCSFIDSRQTEVIKECQKQLQQDHPEYFI